MIIQGLLANLDKETAIMSSPQMMEDTKAFIAIKQLGKDIVPDLLQALRDKQAVLPVIMLLEQITGEWPVKPEDAGRVNQMIADWLAWGKSNGIH